MSPHPGKRVNQNTVCNGIIFLCTKKLRQPPQLFIYMNLHFHGAARTVTGSKHLVQLQNGSSFLLDCGMFQGLGAKTAGLNAQFNFDPATLSFVVLSHAHIDHSGLLPKLVKEGFTGKIYCTGPTLELAHVLLMDSAEIQTYNNGNEAPLYNSVDVSACIKLLEPVNFGTEVNPMEGVQFVFYPNGHLLGSAAVHLTVTEAGTTTTLLYSGDVGRYRSALLPPPQAPPQADYIIMESTYGDKHHDPTTSVVEELLKQVKETCVRKGGQLLIPAFSVGRTQEILYALNQMSLEKRLPEILYFVDSPLSIKATEVLKSYPQLYNERMQKVLEIDDDPFQFPGLKYIELVDDSRRLVEYTDPCVIISASGTADAGRIRHHLEAAISHAKNTVLFAGYCGPTSTGGQLLNGKEEIDLLTEGKEVKASIQQLQGMSAHGDCDDLCQYLSSQDSALVKQIFLVHGEEAVQEAFKARLQRKGFEQVSVPAPGDEVKL